MALLWMEGFDWLSTSFSTGENDLETLMRRRYGQAEMNVYNNTEIVTGRNGGSAIHWRNWYTYHITTPKLQETTTTDTCITGFAWRTPDIFYSSAIVLLELYSVDGIQWALKIDPLGQLSAHPRNAAAAACQTTNTLRTGAWYYVEFKGVCHNTTGSCEIRVNGDQWATATGQDSRVNYDGWTHIRLRNPQSADENQYFDDWYVCNDQGTINNDFLGDVKVVHLNPNADASVAWTPSAAVDHYTLVDNCPLTNDVDDTDYIYDNVATNKDLFDFENLPTEFASASILGVEINSFPRVTNEQVVTFKQKIKSGSTESEMSSTKLMWTEYQNIIDIAETDPDTSAAWTYSGVNGMQAGVEIG